MDQVGELAQTAADPDRDAAFFAPPLAMAAQTSTDLIQSWVPCPHGDRVLQRRLLSAPS